MLEFFRKYQKYFFFLITVVIVISFSFFGTYNTLQQTAIKPDKVAFTAIDATDVRQQKLEEMVNFLSTDMEDKQLLGGQWGPNFLNDGVIRKDFLQAGLASLLIQPYLGELSEDFKTRLLKEKRFEPYRHPQADFLSAKNIWNFAAPKINVALSALKNVTDAKDPSAFDTRVSLFLAEREFPHLALRYVLKQQQAQFQWVREDPNLDRTDLALFQYHTLSDWFGQKFLYLVSEFIMNSAIVAEKRGYAVSEAEAAADLWRNAEISFRQNPNNPRIGVATVNEYFQQQLYRMRMDQTQAINVWRQVMLFRKMFDDIGGSVLIDPLIVQEIQNLSNETVSLDLYRLPPSLSIGDFPTLQKFEIYLSAISDRTNLKNVLDLPTKFKSVKEVAKTHPELVQKRYLIEYKKIDKRKLLAKVGLKETWDWEIEEKNWKKLMAQFPVLGLKLAKTKEQKFASLEDVDKKMRSQIDAFSRRSIVDEHPEWVSQALDEEESDTQEVAVREKGKNAFFVGLKKPKEIIDLLDRYPETKQELTSYTTDEQHFYQIKVLCCTENREILFFEEAMKGGLLDQPLENFLKEQYALLKKENPKSMHKPDGSLMTFPQAEKVVALKAFEPILSAIKQDYQNVLQETGEQIEDYTATLRFFAYMREQRDKIVKDKKSIGEMQKNEETLKQKVLPRKALKEQWSVEKLKSIVKRGEETTPLTEKVNILKPKEWSQVITHPGGEHFFFYLKDRYVKEDKKNLNEKIFAIREMLAGDAKKIAMQHLVNDMQKKNALSLKFLEAL